MSAPKAGANGNPASSTGEISTVDDSRPRSLPGVIDRADQVARPAILPSRADETEALRLSLLRVAASYSERDYVPYVWGGNVIGERDDCEACRACVEANAKLPVQSRRAACAPCNQCGIDCSHFVHKLLDEAGLKYPYLATSKLKKMSPARLRAYNLVDIGRDLSKARPGDLLLQEHHIVMLLAKTSPGQGDLIHVNRSMKHGRVGGIEIKRDIKLSQVAGRIVRILRHAALHRPAKDLDRELRLSRLNTRMAARHRMVRER